MTGSVSPDTAPADAPASWRALRAVPLLSRTDEQTLRALWAGSVPRRVPGGQVVRTAGAPATHLLVLLSGRVTAVGAGAAAPGRSVPFGGWDAPCALDKLAVVDGGGHTATLVAEGPCGLRAVPRDRFLELVDDVPAVRRQVLRGLAAQARLAQDRCPDPAVLPTEARVAAWLLQQAAAGPDGRSAALVGGRQALADHLGTTRVAVSRALSLLRRDGLVAADSDTATVLAPELLELRAHPA